jgi:dsDNA-specific endonuclease/ATPase MutS2
MLYTQKTLNVLEYDKITQMLASCAATDGAKSMALTLLPTDNYDAVNIELSAIGFIKYKTEGGKATTIWTRNVYSISYAELAAAAAK